MAPGGSPSQLAVSPRVARLLWLASILILVPGATVGLAVITTDPVPYSAPAFLEVIGQVGISPVAGAWIGFVLPTVVALVVAMVIRLGRPHDPFALLFGLSIVSLFLLLAGVGTALLTVWPRFWARLVDVVAIELTIAGLFLFPSGRFVPRWTRWPALAAAVTALAVPGLAEAARALGTDTVAPNADLHPALVTGLTLVTLGSWLPAQVYRYRRHSTSLERLQTRWILFGFALVLVGSLGAIVFRVLGVPARAAVWALVTGAVGSLLLPVAAGLAVMRYRLYELNRIISRTVSYAILAASLALTFAGAVFLFTRMLPISGDLAVAGSTLAVAALFNPARRSIQAAVDRRFNRSHYDAAQLIEAFAAKLQTGTGLSDLLTEVKAVLGRTVEPSAAGIWLKEAA